MQPVKRIIRITDNKVYLNPSTSFEVADTNLGLGSVRFGHNHDIYWEIEFSAGGYDSSNHLLTVTVSHYRPVHTDVFNTQEIKGTIQKLHFKGIHWGELEKHLSSYKKKPLLTAGVIIEKDAIANTLETAYSRHATTYKPAPAAPTPIVTPPSQPRIENKSANFDIAFEDAVFETGQVSFLQFFKWHKTPVLFVIKNSWILPQYDFIKQYFSKALGRKTFGVNASMTLTDGVVTETIANSAEIRLIDAALIDKIKYKRTLQLITVPIKREKQTLYTEADIFQSFEETTGGNIFDQSSENILDFILTYKKVRNELQLKHLSAALHDPKQKLRFTLNPLFGFVFYMSNSSQYFFCWELLNSHATYIWSLPKQTHTTESAIDIIEEEISLVEQNGRENYRKLKKQTPTQDQTFTIIEHTNANDIETGFENWKRKIENILQ